MKPAFYHWMIKQFHSDRVLIASYIYSTLKEGVPSDSMLWELMEQTGDETYSRDSFLKAADIVLLD